MAALSCFQPSRPLLAQPARCLDEDHYAVPLTLRRRQLFQRCDDARAQWHSNPAPAPVQQVSVKKTREELTKNASQGVSGAAARRLHIESGWSKVEEVRKKFEGASVAATTSFSRSFESPPRRRLADSLFASFKLPRKKDGMLAPRSPAPQPKRKSAVQLLAETKAFYVKSETVRDRKQELPLRVSSGLSQAIAAGGCHLVSSGAPISNDVYCNPYATTGRIGVSRRAVSAGEGLQNTLRRLLEHSDSRENVYSPPIYAVPHKPFPRRAAPPSSLCCQSKSETGRRRAPSIDPVHHTLLPSPQSSPDSAAGELSAEHVGAISPPAQYAHSAPRYIRSNSHCQPARDDGGGNINSHKSLPDLHTQAHVYPEHGHPGPEPASRSPRRRRHSSHQRTASCSSKGTRSNHSSLMSSCDAFSEHPSPGEETYQYNSRCGSSFARDSGGSSGHYTQGAPPSPTSQPEYRYNSYYPGCYVSAPPQFQDGAPSPPPPPPPPPHETRVGIHFQASAPPPQFQDEPPAYYDEYDCHRAPVKCQPRADRRDRDRDYKRYHEGTTELVSKQPQYAEPRRRVDDTQEYVNTAQICPPEEVTSPLGTFKRQRCLRYKQRRPRPILRSKSDISDRYRRTEGRSPASAPCEADDSPDSLSSSSTRLQAFFSRLGLEARVWDALLARAPNDSPVYFSDASSRDSALLPDYTVQGATQKPIYRNTEPPSVVERNARIVKWLCQCRKTLPQASQAH
ncbi:serine/arginine repetitive matrix protein 1 [Plutella xylostella]|uniref:serine/arginine repetitive matrix protein 1 n=1 Tax=Plutella xylostella TaxID=51655 RepID=UPI0020324190|nr:serine/arginine repetitive matrix protein 1 [Plutella xylostella]